MTLNLGIGVWGDVFHISMFCRVTVVVFGWRVVKKSTGVAHCLKSLQEFLNFQFTSPVL